MASREAEHPKVMVIGKHFVYLLGEDKTGAIGEGENLILVLARGLLPLPIRPKSLLIPNPKKSQNS